MTSSEVNPTMEDNSSIVHYGPPAPQKDNLTFGVEFEFALATAPESGVDPEPHLGRQIFGMQNEESALEHIHDTLKRVQCYGDVDWKPKNTDSWVLKSDPSIWAPESGVYE